MTTWNNISKPTSSYTKTYPSGREAYDDSLITYDQVDMMYDGNVPTWSDISKPTSNWTKV